MEEEVGLGTLQGFYVVTNWEATKQLSGAAEGGIAVVAVPVAHAEHGRAELRREQAREGGYSLSSPSAEG